MPFPTDFPKDAVAALLKINDQDTAHIALAAYEIVGFALHTALGDPQWLAGLDFNSLSKLAEGADLAVRIQARATELKGSGVGVFMIILTLIKEFGPVVLQFVQAIRELLNKGS